MWVHLDSLTIDFSACSFCVYSADGSPRRVDGGMLTFLHVLHLLGLEGLSSLVRDIFQLSKGGKVSRCTRFLAWNCRGLHCYQLYKLGWQDTSSHLLINFHADERMYLAYLQAGFRLVTSCHISAPIYVVVHVPGKTLWYAYDILFIWLFSSNLHVLL